MIYILAKNAEEAKRVARLNDLLPKDWRYAASDMVIRGTRNQTLWLCDGYHEHSLFTEVLNEANFRNFKVFRVLEVTKFNMQQLVSSDGILK